MGCFPCPLSRSIRAVPLELRKVELLPPYVYKRGASLSGTGS